MLADGSECHRLVIAPIVGWLGLDAAEFLEPHEGNGWPIRWLWQDHRHEDRDSKLMPKVGKGAKVSFIERHLSENDIAAQANAITSLEVGEGAEVLWAIVQQQGDQCTHLGQLNVTLAADAEKKRSVSPRQCLHGHPSPSDVTRSTGSP